MYSLAPKPRFVCKHCIQHLSRRRSSTGVDLTAPKARTTRRNNGVTWEGLRFRKTKLEASELKEKWSAPKLLAKKPRLVETDVPTREWISYNTNETNVQASRPVGRIRAGRARIPGPKAAAYLKSMEQSFEELLPSAPSIPHRSQQTEDVEPTEVSPMQIASEETKTPAPDHFNWYWQTIPPTGAETVRADNFFLKSQKSQNRPTLLRSIANFREVPESDVPEVAFVGRSNVGKSSLLNAIVDANVKDLLARTSATRGFTKTMNFYGIGPETGVSLKKDKNGRDKIAGPGLVIVDMPGYGEGSLASWGIEIMKYIQSRKQLRRVFVLLDAEHGIKDKDRSLLASLRLAGVSHQVILSKLDKLYIPPGRFATENQHKQRPNPKPKGTLEAVRKMMEDLKPIINPPVGGGALGEILACSSETMVDSKRLGLDHVRYAVLKAVGLEKRRKHKYTQQ
ncbi:hypothetical protein HBI34_018530 [Parastagonospora nodorum]|nr:hypothetical protein HBI34_018530 [Parastagonospora nodorum]